METDKAKENGNSHQLFRLKAHSKLMNQLARELSLLPTTILLYDCAVSIFRVTYFCMQTGNYSTGEIEQPQQIVTKVVKADAEEAEESTPRPSKKVVRKHAPPRQPLVKSLRFQGDNWAGIHVYQ